MTDAESPTTPSKSSSASKHTKTAAALSLADLHHSPSYRTVPTSRTASPPTAPPSHRQRKRRPPSEANSHRYSPAPPNEKTAMPSCRLLPHGTYSLIPAVLSSMAWLASLFQDGCDFSRLSGSAVQQLAVNPNVPWLEVGFAAYREPYLNTQTGVWQTVFTGACLPYPETDPNDPQNDPSWQASKAFDFVALVLGGAGTFFLWFATCCVFSKATWRWAGYEVLLAAVAQSLSFLWFNNAMCHDPSSRCDLFWGSKADIVSSVFWTVSALSILCHYPTPKESQDGDGVWVEHGSSSHSSSSSSPRHRRHSHRTPSAGRSPSSSTATQSSVELGPNSLQFDAPTVTTAAATLSVPSASDDEAGSVVSSSSTRMAPGEASQQGGGASGSSPREMKDVELT